MKNYIQIVGDHNNPYHLSIGQVVLKGNKVVLIKKDSGLITLPRETTYLNESFSETLVRGAKEELGVIVEPVKFLGSLLSHFNREDGTEVEKTTLYFQTNFLKETEREPERDEENDEIIWIEETKAIEALSRSDESEEIILRRAISV